MNAWKPFLTLKKKPNKHISHIIGINRCKTLSFYNSKKFQYNFYVIKQKRLIFIA